MDFSTACGFVMPLGQHKGKTLTRIGSNDEGILYLDWLIGQDWINGPLKDAITIYLGHPAVSMRLDAILSE